MTSFIKGVTFNDSVLNDNNNNHGGKPRGARLNGAISELKDDVFTIGEKNSLSRHRDVKERITEHVGGKLHSDMYDLVFDGVEATFEKPPRPTGVLTHSSKAKAKAVAESGDDTEQTEEVDPCYLRDHGKDCDDCKKRENAYEAFKGRCFIIIMGQCTQRLKNRITGDKVSWKALRKTNDVVGLLNRIQEIHQSATDNAECEIETLVRTLLSCVNSQQGQAESFTLFQSRLDTLSELFLSHWGKLVPTNLPDGISDKEKFAEKLHAFLLLKGARNENCGDLKTLLHTNYMTNARQHPVNVTNMARLMTDQCKHSQPSRGRTDKRDKDKDGSKEALINNQVNQQQQQEQTEETSTTGPCRRRATPARKTKGLGLFQI